MKDNAAIARIREVRHKISEAHDHDPKRVIDYYIQLQEKYKDRLVREIEGQGTQFTGPRASSI